MEDNSGMRKGSLVVVVLLMQLGSTCADEPARVETPAKPWEALWRFHTHG